MYYLELFGANFDGMRVESIGTSPPETFELACPRAGSYYGWPRARYRATDRLTAGGRLVYQFDGYL